MCVWGVGTPHNIRFCTMREPYVMGGGTPHNTAGGVTLHRRMYGGYPPTIPTHQFCSPFRPPSPPTFPINSTTVPTNPTTFPHPLACPIHPTSLRPTQSRSPVFQPLPSTNPTTFHAHPHLSTSFILCYGGGGTPIDFIPIT